MSRLSDAEVLSLHRELVETRSITGTEAAIADRMAAYLAFHGVVPRRIGDSLVAVVGEGPLVLLDTHLDTVPPAPGWTMEPFAATLRGDRIHGLGANDAKASVAAMTAAFLAAVGRPLPFALGLALVAGEETRSAGTRDVLVALEAEGTTPAAAIFGEPTGLDFAVAQKGLVVLELVARGQAAHAAHARTLGAANAARALARDLVALDAVDLGPADPRLGLATLEPTVVSAGTARNVVPAEARAILDLRTTPTVPPAELVDRLDAAVASDLLVLSDRLTPRATPEGSPLLAAARAARPAARLFGSSTLSDWAVLPASIPAIKVGPGRSERSHTPDEYVLASEIVDGARFYEALLAELAAALAPRRAEGAA